MIGQNKLINKINSLTLETLPHSLIILGEEGSGKHTIVNLIIDKLQLPFFDITNNISLDIIEEIYIKVEPILYLININKISLKSENMLLKLIEEPLNNAYLVLTAENKTSVISTILNRCQVWELEKYTNEQLSYFLSTIKDNYPDYFYLTDIFNTPGQLLYVINYNSKIKDMIQLSDKIIQYIGQANFSNTLTISNKLAYKDEQDKWNFDIFIKVLLYRIKKYLVDNYSQIVYNLYKITNQLLQDSKIAHINKQQLFENYLVTCRLAMRN